MLGIGLITKSHAYVVDSREKERYRAFNFSLSPDQLSFLQIFHSAYSTPARYVMEMFRRLYSLGPQRGIFIFNPLFTYDPSTVQAVYAELSKIIESSPIIIFSDGENCPIGYYFPASISLAEARYLQLLSTVDSDMDLDFLRIAFLLPVVNRQLSCPSLQRGSTTHFFFSDNYRNIYKWVTQRAHAAMSNILNLRNRDISNFQLLTKSQKSHLKAARDSIPFVAINPYHAGDVLFLALALQNTPHFISKVVVNARYLDILTEASPNIIPVVQSAAPPNREGRNIPEEEFFFELARELSEGNIYIYCRVTGDYHISSFHLIDHLAFSVGASLLDERELVANRKTYPSVYRPMLSVGHFKVLLHVDAGWPLKHYPKPFQERLIDLLHSRGFDITILCDEPERDHSAYKRVSFKNMEQFRELLRGHHILVGTDSFPSHYAVHILGLPTICLFSSTKPVNSNARISSRYLYLEKGLSCKPCYYLTRCDRRSKEYCENFVEPERVFSEVVKMLDAVYPLGPDGSLYSAGCVDVSRRGMDHAAPAFAMSSENAADFGTVDDAVLITLSHHSSFALAEGLRSVRAWIDDLAGRYLSVLKTEGFLTANWHMIRYPFRMLIKLLQKN